MTTIETQLTIGDLETYIGTQLEDPRYSGIEIDPILDIILHSKRRLDNGDYMPRVVSEAMASVDEYLFDYSEFEACAI
jgi:hypothetical protein